MLTRASIRLVTGDEVTGGKRDTEWPTFVVVTGPSCEGWVPARHLSDEAGAAVVITPYDTMELELELAAGDEVAVLERDDTSDWWCQRADGSGGRVPVAALEPTA